MLMFIPNLWEFMLVLFTVFFSIFFTPIFQSYILRMESFFLYPFVCAKCCNFWLCLIMHVFYAYLFNPWFLLWGLIVSSVIAYMHIYTAKHQ